MADDKMVILALPFLNALSLKGAEDLLKQEGYVEEKVIEKQDSTCFMWNTAIR